MANSFTNPTLVKSAPHAGKEKQVGDADTLSRTDVINRVSKGILYGGLKRLLNAIADGMTFDFTSVTDPTTTGLPTFAAGAALWPIVVLTNRTGSALAVGDVVALDSANNTSVVAGDTLGSLQQYLIALDTPADVATGRFLAVGYAPTVKAQGTINRLEYVKKSATSKAVETTSITVGATTTPPPGAIGVAVTASAGGFVAVHLFGHTRAASSTPPFLLRPIDATFPNSNFPGMPKNVGTNWVDYTLDYDQTTVETAYWQVLIPANVQFTTATLYVSFRQAAAITGAVVFEARTLTRAEGEAWDTAGNTDTFAAETVPGTAGQVGQVSKALTVTGWAAGEVLMIRLDRKATDAGDTLAEDCKVMHAVLVLA